MQFDIVLCMSTDFCLSYELILMICGHLIIIYCAVRSVWPMIVILLMKYLIRDFLNVK